MKKIIAYILIFLTACSMSAILVPSAHSQTDNVKIVSYSYYLDSSYFLNVVGEVQNVGTNTVDPVFLTGVVTTPGGQTQNSYTQVWVSDLVPGQKAPFDMIFYPLQNTNGWFLDEVGDISLTVAIANATSNYQYPDLAITSSSGAVGDSGNYSGAYVVNGVITNTGTQAATNLTVVGAFFNSTGAVVAVGYTNYLTPTVLEPSATLPFQIAAFDINQTNVPAAMKITSYSLLVQTEEPILKGTAPQATPYTGSGSGEHNPTPTLAPGQTSQNSSGSNILGGSQTNTFIYAAVLAVIIVVIATAFLVFRKKRGTSESAAPAEKPAPVYKPKPTRRNRK